MLYVDFQFFNQLTRVALGLLKYFTLGNQLLLPVILSVNNFGQLVPKRIHYLFAFHQGFFIERC